MRGWRHGHTGADPYGGLAGANRRAGPLASEPRSRMTHPATITAIGDHSKDLCALCDMGDECHKGYIVSAVPCEWTGFALIGCARRSCRSQKVRQPSSHVQNHLAAEGCVAVQALQRAQSG